MSIAQRIKRLIDEKAGGNQSQFCRDTGVNRGTMNNIVNRNTGVTSETMEKILEAYPMLNARWLITGKGKMWGTESVGELQDELETYRKRVAQLEERLQDEKTLVENLNKLSAFLRADIDRMKKEQGFE